MKNTLKKQVLKKSRLIKKIKQHGKRTKKNIYIKRRTIKIKYGGGDDDNIDKFDSGIQPNLAMLICPKNDKQKNNCWAIINGKTLDDLKLFDTFQFNGFPANQQEPEILPEKKINENENENENIQVTTNVESLPEYNETVSETRIVPESGNIITETVPENITTESENITETVPENITTESENIITVPENIITESSTVPESENITTVLENTTTVPVESNVVYEDFKGGKKRRK